MALTLKTSFNIVDDNQKKNGLKLTMAVKMAETLSWQVRHGFILLTFKFHFVVAFCAVFLILEVLLVNANCYRSNIEDGK
jgi:predicted phosphatase